MKKYILSFLFAACVGILSVSAQNNNTASPTKQTKLLKKPVKRNMTAKNTQLIKSDTPTTTDNTPKNTPTKKGDKFVRKEIKAEPAPAYPLPK